MKNSFSRIGQAFIVFSVSFGIISSTINVQAITQETTNLFQVEAVKEVSEDNQSVSIGFDLTTLSSDYVIDYVINPDGEQQTPDALFNVNENNVYSFNVFYHDVNQPEDILNEEKTVEVTEIVAQTIEPEVTQEENLVEPVVTQEANLAEPVVTQEANLVEPVVTQEENLVEPVVTQEENLVEPVVTQEENLVEPVVTQEENLVEPEVTQEENLVEPVVTQEANLVEPAAMSIMPAMVNDFDALKAQIEAATADITIQLNPGTYDATSQITNTNAIKVTLLGTTDVNGLPTTEFVLQAGVLGAPRFLRVEKGTLDLSNISFTGIKSVGGGVSAKNVVANNTVFTNNYTNDGVSGGGAIRATGGTLHIEGSKFITNSVSATSDGGAISSEYSGDVYINNSVFERNERIGNQNQYGGAINIKQPGVANTKISITNSRFIGNVLNAGGTLSTGGAVRIFGTSNLVDVVIDNVLFDGNSAQTSTQNGGALAFMAVTGKTRVSNTTFINNTAGKNGGALYYENATGTHEVVNSTFVGNSSSYFLGSTAIAVWSSVISIDSSTIIEGGIATYGTAPKITLTNSIVAGKASLGSTTIVYSGTNLAKKTSGEPIINAADVFTAYTSSTLVKVNDNNYVAPIKATGPALKAADTSTRLLSTSQNGRNRKTPLSDLGAFEAAYEVKFVFDNGATDLIQTVEPNATVVKPTDPTDIPTKIHPFPVRTGFVFQGWFEKTPDGEYSTEWDFTQPLNDNLVLHAKWASSYTLSFDLNGGTSTAIDSQSVIEGAKGTAVTNPTREGYDFTGWNKAADGSGATWDLTTDTMPAANVTLYAQWTPSTYTITFDANGGVGTMANESYSYLETKALSTNTFTRDHYHFVGWSLTPTGISAYTDSEIYKFEGTANITIYAVWEINENILSFDLNGGTSAAIDPQTVAYGSKATAVTEPTKPGYDFAGWNTSADKTGTTWDFDNTTMPDAAVTLYAQWTPHVYSVTFNANGGVGTMANESYSYLESKPLFDNTYAYEHYHFMGWALTPTGDVVYADQASYTFTLTEDVTLYAVWAINEHQLSFDLNGATSPSINAQTIAYGSKAATVSNPIKDGFDFIGWNTMMDGTGSYWDFNVTTMPDANVVLYAQWKEKVYTIETYVLSFDLNGATGIAPTSQVLETGAYAISPTNPIRDGYEFKGWNTMADGTGSYWDFNMTTMPQNNVVLYAQWTQIIVPIVPKETPKPSLPETGISSPMTLYGSIAALSGLVLVASKKRKK